MAVFSDGGVSTPDLYVFILLLLLFLLSCSLNPLVLYQNYRRPASVARTLYLALCTADLAFCCVALTQGMAHVIHPKEEACWRSDMSQVCNASYQMYHRAATSLETGMSLISWTLQSFPVHITGFLAGSRYYQIRYPLRSLSRSHVALATALSLTTVPIFMFLDLYDETTFQVAHDTTWFAATNLAWNLNPTMLGVKIVNRMVVVLYVGPAVIIQTVAIIVSVLTVWELLKGYLTPVSDRSRKNSTTASVKVLVTNTGSAATLCYMCIVLAKSSPLMEDITTDKLTAYFMFSTVIPSTFSAVNPLIYILLTPNFITSLRKQRNTVQPPVSCALNIRLKDRGTTETLNLPLKDRGTTET